MAEQTIPTGVTRVPGWELRLSLLVTQRLAEPFAWGENDCVLFAADCIEAMTGIDTVAQLRGQWASQGEAVRAIARVGGLNAAVERMGFTKVPPLFAQRGDLVLHRRDGTDALAICLGDKLAGPSESGLLFFGLENGVKAWRIS